MLWVLLSINVPHESALFLVPFCLIFPRNLTSNIAPKQFNDVVWVLLSTAGIPRKVQSHSLESRRACDTLEEGERLVRHDTVRQVVRVRWPRYTESWDAGPAWGWVRGAAVFVQPGSTRRTPASSGPAGGPAGSRGRRSSPG